MTTKMTVNGKTIEFSDDAMLELLETTSFVDEAGNVTEFSQDDEKVEEDS